MKKSVMVMWVWLLLGGCSGGGDEPPPIVNNSPNVVKPPTPASSSPDEKALREKINQEVTEAKAKESQEQLKKIEEELKKKHETASAEDKKKIEEMYEQVQKLQCEVKSTATEKYEYVNKACTKVPATITTPPVATNPKSPLPISDIPTADHPKLPLPNLPPDTIKTGPITSASPKTNQGTQPKTDQLGLVSQGKPLPVFQDNTLVTLANEINILGMKINTGQSSSSNPSTSQAPVSRSENYHDLHVFALAKNGDQTCIRSFSGVSHVHGRAALNPWIANHETNYIHQGCINDSQEIVSNPHATYNSVTKMMEIVARDKDAYLIHWNCPVRSDGGLEGGQCQRKKIGVAPIDGDPAIAVDVEGNTHIFARGMVAPFPNPGVEATLFERFKQAHGHVSVGTSGGILYWYRPGKRNDSPNVPYVNTNFNDHYSMKPVRLLVKNTNTGREYKSIVHSSPTVTVHGTSVSAAFIGEYGALEQHPLFVVTCHSDGNCLKDRWEHNIQYKEGGFLKPAKQSYEATDVFSNREAWYDIQDVADTRPTIVYNPRLFQEGHQDWRGTDIIYPGAGDFDARPTIRLGAQRRDPFEKEEEKRYPHFWMGRFGWPMIEYGKDPDQRLVAENYYPGDKELNVGMAIDHMGNTHVVANRHQSASMDYMFLKWEERSLPQKVQMIYGINEGIRTGDTKAYIPVPGQLFTDRDPSVVVWSGKEKNEDVVFIHAFSATNGGGLIHSSSIFKKGEQAPAAFKTDYVRHDDYQINVSGPEMGRISTVLIP